MQQPPGFILSGQETKVCRLLCSLYGLKQSPRAWYERIDASLRQLGLHRNNFDPNLYFLHKGNQVLLLLLYVDDLFITRSSSKLISWLKSFLQQTYDMTDLGLIRKYLGITFDYLPHGIFLHQWDYALSILNDFAPKDLRPAKTPLPAGQILSSETHTPSVDSTTYSQLVGKLIFLTITRLDLAFAVNRIASYMAAPQQAHLESAMHILRYVLSTFDHGILYNNNPTFSIQGFTDADWATCPDTRRSIGAYLFLAAGGPVSWQSKRQLTISRSSTESEYKSLSDGVQEGVWLSRLLTELKLLSSTVVPVSQANSDINSSLAQLPVTINCDNQSTLKLARNPVFHARSKHNEIHYHFVRERLQRGEIDLKYIHTAQQPADLLTKSLGRVKFELHRRNISIYNLQFLKSKTNLETG